VDSDTLTYDVVKNKLLIKQQISCQSKSASCLGSDTLAEFLILIPFIVTSVCGLIPIEPYTLVAGRTHGDTSFVLYKSHGYLTS